VGPWREGPSSTTAQGENHHDRRNFDGMPSCVFRSHGCENLQERIPVFFNNIVKFITWLV
jgi:hypothetical protein